MHCLRTLRAFKLTKSKIISLFDIGPSSRIYLLHTLNVGTIKDNNLCFSFPKTKMKAQTTGTELCH